MRCDQSRAISTEFEMAGSFGIVDRIYTAWKHLFAPLGRAILDFVYPPACLLCGDDLAGDEAGFCESCATRLKPALSNQCPRCGAPVGLYVDLTDGCAQCRRESFAFDRVIRLGIYDREMRNACLRAKSSGGSGLARGLAAALVVEHRGLFDDLAADLVVPIPEHWTRRIRHPHYAAETLSHQIAQQLSARWGRNTLGKLRRTPKQATSSTTVRRQQQQGSFGIRRGADLSGQTILLIDDILTTGSTASAAARALKDAGACQVVVVVIAVSPLRV
jgi:predicted amidophosphoribosyltransferase